MGKITILSAAARAAGANEAEIDDAIERENDLATECEVAGQVFEAEQRWPLTIDKVERGSEGGWEIRYRALAPTGEDTTHVCLVATSMLSPRAVLHAVATDWMRTCERRRYENVAEAMRGVHVPYPFHVAKGAMR